MKKNNMLLVGFTVQGYDLRDGSGFEDFTAVVVSGSIIDVEYGLICLYRKRGFELTSVIREETFAFNSTNLHHFFKNGNFEDLEVIQK